MMHWLPNQDTISKYRTDDTPMGYGYGSAVGNVLGDAIAGRDLSSYGLSDKGTQFYNTAAKDWKQWSIDNANFMVHNRNQPGAIQQKYLESAQGRGILPANFNIDMADIPAMLHRDPALAAAYAADPSGFMTSMQENAMTGVSDYISEHGGDFRNSIQAPVMGQYFRNQAEGYGDFLSNMIGDIGQGAGNVFTYLLEMLGKISPAFKTMWTNIQGHRAKAKGLQTGSSGQPGGSGAIDLTPSGVGDISQETIDALREAAIAAGYGDQIPDTITPEMVEKYAPMLGIEIQRIPAGGQQQTATSESGSAVGQAN